MESSQTKTFLDRKKQKELVRPFRKYQLIILLLVIIMIVFCGILISLNKKLNSKIKEHSMLYQELLDQYEREDELDELYNRVEVNYVSLYELDKELNIDIIRDLTELNLITTFIDPTAEIQFSVCFKATVHGDKGKTFREKCGGVSPLLILIKAKNGYRFGAYTTVGFSKDPSEATGFKKDPDAFLFSFDTKKRYKIYNVDQAIGDFGENMPQFGDHDIFLFDGFLGNTTSESLFPKSYSGDSGMMGDFILTGGVKKFGVSEVEILSVYINKI